jgi:hypothetical protein
VVVAVVTHSAGQEEREVLELAHRYQLRLELNIPLLLGQVELELLLIYLEGHLEATLLLALLRQTAVVVGVLFLLRRVIEMV